MLRLVVVFGSIGLLTAACGLPCRTDNDCQTAGGVERCVVDTGVCEPLPTRPPPTCGGDADCEGGRACVDSSCVFAPQCQHFTAPQPLTFAGVCDGASVGGQVALNTADCVTTLSLAGLADVTLGLVPPETSGTLILDECADAVHDAAGGVIGLRGCALGGFAACDLGVSTRLAAQACVVGAGPECGGGLTCGAVAALGDLSVGACE